MALDSLEKRLEQLVPSKGRLEEAVRYALLAPAGRFRPRLLLAAGDDFALPQKTLLDCAAALEMIHTYSLIHDDLPCMDNDTLRRGKPTLHIAYPEWLALLAGDYLLTKAFEITAPWPEVTALLARKAGGDGMIGGQVLDLSHSEAIDEMHRKKTGALIEAALVIPGLLAGSDTAKLETAGAHLGMAFQAFDDIADATKTREEMGKPTGLDAIRGKVTAVTALGLDKAYARAETHLETCCVTLSAMPKTTAFIRAWAETRCSKVV